MPTDIMVYQDIGYTDWDGNGLTAESFNRELNNVPANETELNVRINSVGGLVADGIAIYNSIRSFARKRNSFGTAFTVNTIVEGFAYSSAATIAMAGDKRIMMKGTSLMIHNASSFAWGDCRELREEANRLEKFNELISGFYTSASGMKKEDILDLMNAETYFSPEEALSAKLISSVDDGNAVENMKKAFGEDLTVITNLKDVGQYDLFMSRRVTARGRKAKPVDIKEVVKYNGPRPDQILLELDLLDAESD